MKKRITDLWKILKSTAAGWMEDDPFRQSAVIAYYAIFSLPALLVLIINVTGFFFEREAISGEITRQISGVMGSDTGEQVKKIIASASEVKAGLIPGAIAIVLLISGATGVFVQLQIVLNQIWGVKQKPQSGVVSMVRNRIFSFGLILAIGFLLLVSLVISSMLAAASHWLERALSDSLAYLIYVADFVVSLSVVSAMFALMFKYLPDVKIAWRNVWVGAILTGFLFILGKYGLSFYFGKASPGSVYGAAGSIILILLWVSYSSMIVFFGAEFTQQYAVATGAEIVVAKNAVITDANAGIQLAAAKAEVKTKPTGFDTTIKIDGEEQLQREIDKKQLHLVIKKVQIKDAVASLFNFRKLLHLPENTG
jgi:membrane protein